ncbi:Hydantoinase/oxoprolinase [Pseudonocardia dioxanivorans CB1190]|uniref:Hydantoinase/oxoprolinase n=1 Tax=Pseudonocardia dioxanivorans (strain ATCC 55486 / DSM 44775 / JCM 13855 / CB1190) TaxID=675635 RepID=F4D1X4_PSEUX|nr:hydantoinase/oxoprolinase family protein [Pseudonocardia dioxanivorans]AEA28034.1 Hydantoinase/oxoprolinase [Pseudonocardia dioxanivorans CB1190]
MLNIDIDTGGTMTDGLVSGDGTVFSIKVETTPHDVTLSFLEILEAARGHVGAASLRDLLDDVALIRWSSTITSNVLAQKSGPKLGLIVSAGHEDDLYTSPEEAATVLGPLITRENITGISADADDDEVRTAVKGLFDKGIRRINISLEGAFEDNSRERKIVSMIDAQYPDHFLGSIPALPASEILLRPDDSTRTFVSLINAYVHPSLATTLYRAEETLKQEHSWRGNVLVGHINGGVARIGKTTAFDTIESGPLFGTHASAAEAARLGDAKVLAIDVGGTTAKVSAVENGRVVDRDEGHLFGIPVRTNLPLLRSIALGGGSVARASGGTVSLGPDSMGAAPGPACYGLGGRNATTTDAFLLLGYLAPDAFLDGRRTLDADAARDAIARTVGDPLGISPVEAAQRIVDIAFDMTAALARETATEMGWDPADTAVYAFGGNGPLFATGVAERIGARTVRMFGFGNVLSAYGSAISDVLHVYESAVNSADAARTGAELLADEARRDLEGEGFPPDEAVLHWEVRGTGGSRGTADGSVEAALSAVDDPSLVRLTARFPLPSLEKAAVTGGAGAGGRGERGGIPTRDWASVAGSTVTGPALVDGGSFTWLVGPGWSLAVDPTGDAVATRGGN